MREPILAMLKAYEELWCSGKLRYPSWNRMEEKASVMRLIDFVETNPNAFSRDNAFGHITGSAFVINKNWDRVLLTLHKKLGKWLQLGGHSDDDPRPDRVAWREAEEESGLTKLEWAHVSSILGNKDMPLPFDCDVHWIPARRAHHGVSQTSARDGVSQTSFNTARHGEAAHWHFDLRFLIVADDQEPLQISSESKDLRWFSLPEAMDITTERSMHRPFEKIMMLREKL